MRLGLLTLLLPPLALADVGELSFRPHLEVRHGPLVHPDPLSEATQDEGSALRYGAGLTTGLGLGFAWTLTLGYTWDTSTTLRRRPFTDRARQDLDRWVHDRHSLLAGITWAPSDAFTPLLSLEAGLAAAHLRDIAAEQAGADTLRRDAFLELAPAARASLGLEWKFADFWGVAVQGFAEHADGFGYGGRLWLASYRYL
jgi:hypothetical protein